MRVVLVTLSILVIFITGSFMINKYIDSSCESLLEDIKLLDKSIKDNEWDSAKDQLSSLKGEWEDTKGRWELFLEHYEMDMIDITIARLDQYVEINNRSLALGEMAEFRLLISHIKEKEAVGLRNIL